MKNDDQVRAAALLARAGWLAGEAPGLAAALLAEGRLVHLSSGQWAQAEGDAEAGLLVVISGAVQLFCAAPGGREVLVGHAQTGAALGQAGRFGGGPRLVTAIAAQPSLVLMASDAALDRIARDHPAIWRAVARLVYAQLSITVRATAELIALSPKARLASRLLTMAAMNAVGMAADGPPSLRISQQALAEMVGLSRKTVNGYLSGFETRGLLTTGYGTVTLLDLPGLKRASEQQEPMR